MKQNDGTEFAPTWFINENVKGSYLYLLGLVAETWIQLDFKRFRMIPVTLFFKV